jgi:hypothetical protein
MIPAGQERYSKLWSEQEKRQDRTVPDGIRTIERSFPVSPATERTPFSQCYQASFPEFSGILDPVGIFHRYIKKDPAFRAEKSIRKGGDGRSTFC